MFKMRMVILGSIAVWSDSELLQDNCCCFVYTDSDRNPTFMVSKTDKNSDPEKHPKGVNLWKRNKSC